MATTVLSNYRHQKGTHPESTALSNFLRCFGLNFSEAFLFGLGRGLNFIYWQGRRMPAPLIRGRIKPDGIVKNVAEVLGARCELVEVATVGSARTVMLRELEAGHPVLIRLGLAESRLLAGALESDYFVVVGMEGEDFLALAQADGEEPDLAALEHLYPTWTENGIPQVVIFRPDGCPKDLKHVVRTAVRRHAAELLEPPVPYLGIKGIRYFATSVVHWPDRLRDVSMAASVFVQSWEHPYAGGDGYRGLYRRYLIEAFDVFPCRLLEEAVRTLGRVMVYWRGVVAALREVADGPPKPDGLLRESSRLLGEIARLEEEVMFSLSEL